MSMSDVSGSYRDELYNLLKDPQKVILNDITVRFKQDFGSVDPGTVANEVAILVNFIENKLAKNKYLLVFEKGTLLIGILRALSEDATISPILRNYCSKKKDYLSVYGTVLSDLEKDDNTNYTDNREIRAKLLYQQFASIKDPEEAVTTYRDNLKRLEEANEATKSKRTRIKK